MDKNTEMECPFSDTDMRLWEMMLPTHGATRVFGVALKSVLNDYYYDNPRKYELSNEEYDVFMKKITYAWWRMIRETTEQQSINFEAA